MATSTIKVDKLAGYKIKIVDNATFVFQNSAISKSQSIETLTDSVVTDSNIVGVVGNLFGAIGWPITNGAKSTVSMAGTASYNGSFSATLIFVYK